LFINPSSLVKKMILKMERAHGVIVPWHQVGKIGRGEARPDVRQFFEWLRLGPATGFLTATGSYRRLGGDRADLSLFRYLATCPDHGEQRRHLRNGVHIQNTQRTTARDASQAGRALRDIKAPMTESFGSKSLPIKRASNSARVVSRVRQGAGVKFTFGHWFEMLDRTATGTHERIPCFGCMLTIVEAQQRTEEFLTGQMLEALRAVEYQLPSFDSESRPLDLAAAARATVEIRHVRGASDASYMVGAFATNCSCSHDLLTGLQEQPEVGCVCGGTGLRK
jgi:hypothetical protein